VQRTGTWRRNPEARWRLTEAELGRITAIQSRLLDLAVGLLKPGGRVIFVTCSLLDEEGADQFAAFLKRHHNVAAMPIDLGAGQQRGEGSGFRPPMMAPTASLSRARLL
jgi:16S rRNA (cytosine967-C5)-methyltransferase